MLAEELGLRNFLNINVVYTRKLAQSITYLGLNPTSALPEAISAAGPVQMKENSSFSFSIAHHHLVLRPQTSFPGGLGIPGDERYG
jgi:hypothetical protein